MKPPTLTAEALSWVNRSLMVIRTSVVLLLTLDKVGCAARRRTHSALGLTPQRRTPVWGLAQDAVRPGCLSLGKRTLEPVDRGKERETRSGLWLRCKYQHDGNRVERGATGLPMLAHRSVLKLRTGYLRSVAMPQSYGSGRS